MHRGASWNLPRIEPKGKANTISEEKARSTTAFAARGQSPCGISSELMSNALRRQIASRPVTNASDDQDCRADSSEDKQLSVSWDVQMEPVSHTRMQ